MQVKKQQLEPQMEQWTGLKLVKEWRLCTVTLLIQLICRVHYMKCWSRWSTAYLNQQPQIWRWYHHNDRKWRGTKKPLDEGERGEWKIWLKTQHSKNEDHHIRSYHFMANRWKKWKQWQILFSWTPESLQTVTASMKLKKQNKTQHLLLGRKAVINLVSEWVKLLSHVRLFATAWAVAYHAPPSTGFSRQEYWSELPFPSPEDLPHPGIESGSPSL